MKLLSSRRRIVVIAALVLLVLFLIRPGASRLKSRIIYSMSAALGRPVDIGSVHVRFLPRPGFDLENLVVYDDPAFGGEPMLRASSVTADLRLTSLVRRRIEVSRLDLSEPSLNLVHGQNGRWNLEALLERAAHTPLAPTAKAKSESRPGFPYIEATSARINFKRGPEKRPYALTNADFSLWQDSENTWGVRLKAQPFRTDLNLTDVGMLQVNGTWQRADTLRNTPLQLTVNWSGAQLGQITKFFSGNDQGWRGAGELELTLGGTPAHLQIASSATVQDFRRYDVTSGSALRLAVNCNVQYSSPEHFFHDLDCKAPVGEGLLTLKGSSGFPGSHNHDLVLAADNVPASSALALFERVKKNLPEDLAAKGTIQGSFTVVESSAPSQAGFSGKGEISEFQLSSAGEKAQIGPGTIPFWLTGPSSLGGSEDALASQAGVRSGKKLQPRKNEGAIADGLRLEFGPVNLATGRTAPAASGGIDRTGYNISVTGESEVSTVLRLGRLVGIPVLQTTAEGSVQVDLQIAGSWRGESLGGTAVAPGPQVTGSAKLRNVRVTVRATSAPVEVSSADLRLAADGVHVRKLYAKAADSSWAGSIDLPRGCATPAGCPVHFDLSANQISLTALSEWASPRPKDRPWYRVLQASNPAAPSFLASLHAVGRVATDRLQLKAATASHVSGSVSLDSGKITVAQLKGNVLSGKHIGTWDADFTVKPGICRGSGTVTGISLDQVAQSMNDGWISGTVNANYDVSGNCPGDFWSSAEGTLVFDAHDGALPHIYLTDSRDLLKFTRFTGRVKFQDSRLELKDARLDSPAEHYLLTGSVSSDRELDLKLARPAIGPAGGYSVSGTLAEPRVSASGAEQARLKP